MPSKVAVVQKPPVLLDRDAPSRSSASRASQ